MTKQDFRDYGMKGGPATAKERKLRSFSTLKAVIVRYGLESDEILELIPLFSAQTHEIQDSDEHFAHCIADILFKLKNYGSLTLWL